MNPILESLNFPEDNASHNELGSSVCECLLCTEVFDLEADGNDKLLAHLLIKHKLVIADQKEIADLKGFVINNNLDVCRYFYFLFLSTDTLTTGDANSPKMGTSARTVSSSRPR